MKTLILIFLSALLFLGNIGIPVFTHACEEDGIFTSFFINQQNHCQEEKSDLPPCCQNEKKKKNCCHDEKTVVQLDENYVVTHALSIPDFHFSFVSNAFCTFDPNFIPSEFVSLQTWDDPPPLRNYGKALLILHCVFRI